MSRPHVTHLLTDFMDEALPWQPTEKVKAHLAFCNACRQALTNLKRGIAVLGETPFATPSSDLERRIVDWMSVERVQPPQTKWRRPDWLPRGLHRRHFPVAGAVALGLLFAGWALTRGKPPAVEPPPAAEPPRKAPKAPKRVAKSAAIAVAAAKAAEAKDRADAMPAPLEGSQSGITEPGESLIRSASAWRELWLRHHARADRVPRLPLVDFETEQVIAIFAGEKPTAGYRVKIVDIEDSTWNGEPARVVRYRIQGPPKNALTAQVISQPFLFRIVPKRRGPTYFEKSP